MTRKPDGRFYRSPRWRGRIAGLRLERYLKGTQTGMKECRPPDHGLRGGRGARSCSNVPVFLKKKGGLKGCRRLRARPPLVFSVSGLLGRTLELVLQFLLLLGIGLLLQFHKRIERGTGLVRMAQPAV